MKKRVIFICILLMLCILAVVGCLFVSSKNERMEYAVYIGEESDHVDQVHDIDVLVIDAEYFSKSDIQTLRDNGVREIYTYINVGAIEDFRDYYDDYKDITLDEYENWPEERWVDVSQKEWQDFIATRVDLFCEKGIDGFFIDNADVYYLYPEDEIYEGLIRILTDIKDCDKKVIINGGDCFVSEYLEDESIENNLIDGVNQEDVYTRYDFSNETYGINDADDREYYDAYLSDVLAHGCKAYVLEYAHEQSVQKEAYQYAKAQGYVCYVSDNIELKIPGK